MPTRRPPHPEQKRKWDLNHRYGITTEDYDTRFLLQDGVCAICKAAPKANRLPVDHDHDTGAIRGLLCVRCNSSIEWFINYRDAVAAYLEGTP